MSNLSFVPNQRFNTYDNLKKGRLMDSGLSTQGDLDLNAVNKVKSGNVEMGGSTNLKNPILEKDSSTGEPGSEKKSESGQSSQGSTKSSSMSQDSKKTETIENNHNKVMVNLKKGMMDIGFKHVEIEKDCVTFSINSATTEKESKYMIFDLLLFTRHNDEFLVMKTFYSEDEATYKFPKPFIPHLLKLVNSINQKLNIGGFYFDFSNSHLYFEISQIYNEHSKELHKICCKLTDEVVMAMSAYSKGIFAFIEYLKLIKGHLKEQKKKEGWPELKQRLNEDIQDNIREFVKRSKERYEFMRKRDTNFNWINVFDASDSVKESRIASRLGGSLESLMLFSKYKLVAGKIRVPHYSLEHDSRYCSLKETLERRPGILAILQDVLLKLLEVGLTLNIKTELFDHFITTNDEFIHLRLSSKRQLSDILVEVPETERKVIRSAYLHDVNSLAVELVGKEYFDFSILKRDYSELLVEVE